MKVGISTYAFRWEVEKLPKEPQTLKHLISKTKTLGGEVFQICDYDEIVEFSEQEVKDISLYAEQQGIELELGTQGIHPDHLKTYAVVASWLKAATLRSMVHSKNTKPSNEEAVHWLKESLDSLIENNVKIALETYEPVKTKDLVEIVEEVNHPHVGICLDPANSISELEMPNDVIDNVIHHSTNVHLKDFIFIRKDRTIGFDLIGTPVGEGQLDLEYLLNSLNGVSQTPNGIIELWLPYQGSMEETIKVEDEWIQKSIKNMKNALSQYQKVSR
ncbi:sugar phosphate isomerase/epimerase [Alteribacillus sp. YIM 98480]|uniref:sugar phosphate isomerase/epimerase family protein n=1 Tax=Alteribacillus sp. YIM 98480 TaxID=2606599 RepID=UPI00131C2B09|nr:TIM barrel protein [Alteribacillus sp. YIM 98480]